MIYHPPNPVRIVKTPEHQGAALRVLLRTERQEWIPAVSAFYGVGPGLVLAPLVSRKTVVGLIAFTEYYSQRTIWAFGA